MADTKTTHLDLIKQDAAAVPDYEKDHSNLDKLDTEIFARGKAFNGQAVGEDGEFHVRTVPYAENLETAFSQRSNQEFIIRTTGGEASITTGNGWLMDMKGNSIHTGHTPQDVDMNVIPIARDPGVETLEASIDDDVFISNVSAASGTITLTYTTNWSANLASYGIAITHGTAMNGDSIVVTYVKEVPGTITTATPATFVSTGWNLFDYTNGYARLIKYEFPQDNPPFKISGDYSSLLFKYNLDDETGISITPINGGFNPFDSDAQNPDPVGTTGYLIVTGGNNTDTAIWMTREDWGSGYNWDGTQQGAFEPYTASVVNLATFMSTNFPYGLLKAGDAVDEINLNTNIAYSRVERLANNSTNMTTAKNSGRQYEYDENYIYLERANYVTLVLGIAGGFDADDHGIEFYTGTEVAVPTQTTYGENLKNKLERDVVTISQQTLTPTQQAQVRTNIGAFASNYIIYSSTEPTTGLVEGMIWLEPVK